MKKLVPSFKRITLLLTSKLQFTTQNPFGEMEPQLVPNNTILQYSRGRIFDDVMSNRNFTPSCRLFLKSKNTTQMSRPLSKYLCQSSTADTKAPVVDLPLRKPYWDADIGQVLYRWFNRSEWTCCSRTLLRIGSSDIGRQVLRYTHIRNMFVNEFLVMLYYKEMVKLTSQSFHLQRQIIN